MPRRVNSSRIGTTMISGYISSPRHDCNTPRTSAIPSPASHTGRCPDVPRTGVQQPLAGRILVNNHIIMNIQENVALAPLTTLKVGGPARYFAQTSTAGEVAEAVQF